MLFPQQRSSVAAALGKSHSLSADHSGSSWSKAQGRSLHTVELERWKLCEQGQQKQHVGFQSQQDLGLFPSNSRGSAPTQIASTGDA